MHVRPSRNKVVPLGPAFARTGALATAKNQYSGDRRHRLRTIGDREGCLSKRESRGTRSAEPPIAPTSPDRAAKTRIGWIDAVS